jgi:rod shape-determining protein MreD
MVRGLICLMTVAIAVIIQLTIVNRIAFPGGSGPDLVLIAVAALALAGGPMTGVLIGFFAGLALDVAPPGSHFVGQDALVFCLIGYLCGLVADVPNSEGVPEQGRTALFEIVVTAIGAVLGEALAALLGTLLSDPRVSWPAIQHVLPMAAAYDVVLCPFVLYAAAAALRLTGAPRGDRSRAAWASPLPRNAASAAQGAVRQVNGSGTPRLKLGHVGGTAKVRFAARRGGGMLGGAMALNSNLGRSGLNSSRFGRTRMGRSLLGGSVFSHSPSALRASAPGRRPASIGGSSFLGGRKTPFLTGLRTPALGGSATGYGPRLSRSGTLARLTGALRRSHQPRLRSHQGTFRQPVQAKRMKSPGHGWLRGSSLSGRTGPGWPSGRAPRLGGGPGRLHMPRPRAGKRWRTGGYR